MIENLTNVNVIWRVDVNEVIKEVVIDDVLKLHDDIVDVYASVFK